MTDYAPDSEPCPIPDDLRCKAQVKSGARCRRARKRGSPYCERRHAATDPLVVEVPAVPAPAAAKEKARTQAVEVARAAGMAVPDGEGLEPVEVMDWAVSQAHRVTDAFMAKLNEPGRDVTADDMAPTARMAMDWLKTCIAAASTAESAGMQRRRAVLEEAKVRLAAGAIERALERAGLSDEATARIRLLIGEELSLVGSDG